MKILISVDIEGVAGVFHPEQTRPSNPEYERARRLMTAEANAAIRGAFVGGASEVLVNDSHGGFRNLLPDELDPRARAVLEERMTAPPTLEQLAAELGTRPFPLLRAFRDVYGMPPHTWLTDARVRRARALLDAGLPPARAAAATGFTDQPHLNRHFTRIVGVPPGAYQRERRNLREGGDAHRRGGDARGREDADGARGG